MALRRKRDSSMIWPGFVDAVTTLLMVLMFVLTIFTVMQSVLRDTQVLFTAEVTLVCMGADGKAARIPQALRAALA